MSTSTLRAVRPHDFANAAAVLTGLTMLLVNAFSLLFLAPIINFLWRADWQISALSRLSTTSNVFEYGLAQRLAIAIVCTVVAAAVAWLYAYKLTDKQDVVPNLPEGDARLYRHSHARVKLAEYFARENGRSAAGGLWFAPHMQLPFENEVENIFINGNQKSGKSTLLRALIEQSIERGDRVLIHSFKEEFSRHFGPNDAVLIAPHLAGAWAWDIANDLLNEQDAAEFAARLIPASDNPFWSLAARAVFTDIMTDLMRQKPRSWSWRDLALATFKTPDEIKAILDKVELGSWPLYLVDDEGMPNNTTHGVMATMIASVLSSIKPLAMAWDKVPPHRRFSIRTWLTDPAFAHRVVIFQSAGAYPGLTQLVGGGLVERIRSIMMTELPDSDSRRVVLALDELNQLGTLDGLDNMVATCRSKGLVLICATQSFGQLRNLYGEKTDIIRQLFRWQIVSKIPQGKPGEDVAALLMSKRKIVWEEKRGGEEKPARFEEERYPVMPARMEGELGVSTDAKGNRIARMALTGAGNVFEFEIPKTTWKVRRNTFKPASWTKPIGAT